VTGKRIDGGPSHEAHASNPKRNGRGQDHPHKTTFLELIQELAKLTKDDNDLVAAVRNIFRQYNVKFTRTLAPVKLVATVKPARAGAGRRPSWA